MRKLIAEIAVSLDGFIEGPDGELDWMLVEKDEDYLKTIKNRFDTIFYGRVSYERFGIAQPDEPFLSDQEKQLNDFIAKIRKYVFSYTAKHLPGNGMLVNENIETVVKRIKDEEGKDILLFGGPDILKTFIDLGLVDEYILALHPRILGAGKPLFRGITNQLSLKLLQTRRLKSGVVILHYRPNQDNSA
ncbi:dihydrofolate reductase family protein [Chryseosolibacter indicus]|uniref:Dihydrofolate reductase family protein n=1 Tax=Chryseosolibacter indicus TaxID=2782351 RepID=A0ABS5VS54_9BACT|nr:dihydrofolate reductase family protein [Chryseosolibacter indicus]MBT1703694.1 dihydrofolate reductase family protein [Chryseosolibacter indicus]